MVGSTGSFSRSTSMAEKRNQSAGRGAPLASSAAAGTGSAPRSRRSCGTRSAPASCGRDAGAVDARSGPPARRVAADRRRRLRPARSRGLPDAAAGRAALRQRRRCAPATAPDAAGAAPAAARRPRYDFQPSAPDVAPFPRTAWLRSLRAAVSEMTDAELGYGDPCGLPVLRTALADYLGRVRGVVADPACVVVTSGYSQGLSLFCRVLAGRGARRLALEDPCDPEYHVIVARAGLEPVPVRVDADGLVVDDLIAAGVDGVVVTPAHQSPTGAVLAARPPHGAARLAARRRARPRSRTTTTPSTATTGPRSARSRGSSPTASCTPARPRRPLRPACAWAGWSSLPPSCADLRFEKRLADRGTAHIDQHAFADFVDRGELDRHLRRMRQLYRGRRDALVADADRGAARRDGARHRRRHARDRRARARRRRGADPRGGRERDGSGSRRCADYGQTAKGRAPVLMLGYGQIAEAAIPAGIRELAEAITAARNRPS